MRIMVSRGLSARRAAGIKRHVNAGRGGDDHGGLTVRYFTAPVATLYPLYAAIRRWRLCHPTMC